MNLYPIYKVLLDRLCEVRLSPCPTSNIRQLFAGLLLDKALSDYL